MHAFIAVVHHRINSLALCLFLVLGGFTLSVTPSISFSSLLDEALTGQLAEMSTQTGDEEEEPIIETGGYQFATAGETGGDEEEEPIIETGGYQFAAAGETGGDEEEEPIIETGGYQFA